MTGGDSAVAPHVLAGQDHPGCMGEWLQAAAVITRRADLRSVAHPRNGYHMTNLATALKEEIRRLARKEIRAETLQTKRSSAQHRRDIAALKRQSPRSAE